MWKVHVSYLLDTCWQYDTMYPADGYAVATRSRLGRDPPPTLLNEVNCIGTENTISECPESSSLCVRLGAGVICQGNSQDVSTDMLLHRSTLPNKMHE